MYDDIRYLFVLSDSTRGQGQSAAVLEELTLLCHILAGEKVLVDVTYRHRLLTPKVLPLAQHQPVYTDITDIIPILIFIVYD